MQADSTIGLSGIEQLIAEEGNRLLAFIRKRAPEGEAEDILQDVFYQLTSTGTDKIEHLSSWLFTVARNKITDFYRKKKPEPFTKFEQRHQHQNHDALF